MSNDRNTFSNATVDASNEMWNSAFADKRAETAKLRKKNYPAGFDPGSTTE